MNLYNTTEQIIAIVRELCDRIAELESACVAKDAVIAALGRDKIALSEQKHIQRQLLEAELWAQIRKWKPYLHFCLDWDGLLIDKGDLEFASCSCYCESVAPSLDTAPEIIDEMRSHDCSEDKT